MKGNDMSSAATDHFVGIEKFEAGLWKIADDLRANSGLASNEYFMPIMGLLFLRQASNRYYAALAAIEADKAAGNMPDRDLVEADFARRRAMMLPEAARYDVLLQMPKDGKLSAALSAAMEVVERRFPPLAGQLPRRSGETPRDPHLLDAHPFAGIERRRHPVHRDLPILRAADSQETVEDEARAGGRERGLSARRLQHDVDFLEPRRRHLARQHPVADQRVDRWYNWADCGSVSHGLHRNRPFERGGSATPSSDPMPDLENTFLQTPAPAPYRHRPSQLILARPPYRRCVATPAEVPGSSGLSSPNR